MPITIRNGPFFVFKQRILHDIFGIRKLIIYNKNRTLVQIFFRVTFGKFNVFKTSSSEAMINDILKMLHKLYKYLKRNNNIFFC